MTSDAYGAPEEIRTPDPHIRSLVTPQLPSRSFGALGLPRFYFRFRLRRCGHGPEAGRKGAQEASNFQLEINSEAVATTHAR